jgi:hypothetical protein
VSCECHQIGGRFIAEDPDCPAHGLEAQREERRRDAVISALDEALDSEDHERIEDQARQALYYLRSL